MTYHTTVLLHEGVQALNIDPKGTYVDATLGAGGHSNMILEHLGSEGRLLGFDQDADAVKNAPADARFELCFGNFRFIKPFLIAKGVDEVDGIIADLGVSGHHFDEATRGFSFRFDARLDMRMNTEQSKDAIEVLNDYDEADLRSILWKYGESSFGRQIAREVVKSRLDKAIQSTGDLVAIVERAVPTRKQKAELPKVFQAIRIEVNDELGALQDFLIQVPEVLAVNGNLVVLSYHSLEDRLVKHFLRAGNFEDEAKKDLYGNVERPLDPVGKVIKPSDEEIENNSRARSAKMRIGRKR